MNVMCAILGLKKCTTLRDGTKRKINVVEIPHVFRCQSLVGIDASFPANNINMNNLPPDIPRIRISKDPWPSNHQMSTSTTGFVPRSTVHFRARPVLFSQAFIDFSGDIFSHALP